MPLTFFGIYENKLMSVYDEYRWNALYGTYYVHGGRWWKIDKKKNNTKKKSSITRNVP